MQRLCAQSRQGPGADTVTFTRREGWLALKVCQIFFCAKWKENRVAGFEDPVKTVTAGISLEVGKHMISCHCQCFTEVLCHVVCIQLWMLGRWLTNHCLWNTEGAMIQKSTLHHGKSCKEECVLSTFNRRKVFWVSSRMCCCFWGDN